MPESTLSVLTQRYQTILTLFYRETLFHR